MTDETTALKVYNSLGDSISEDDRLTASNIVINNVLDGIDSANFQLDDSSESIDKGDDIVIVTGTDNHRIFVGQVNWIDIREPRHCYCLGMLERMNWYVVDENNTKTIKDEGLITGVVGDHTIQCDPPNEDEPPIAFTADQYNYAPATGSFYYLLVSDTTTETDNVECENAGNNCIGYQETKDGFDHYANNVLAVDKGTSGSGTNWEGHWIKAAGVSTGYMIQHLEIEHEEIVKTARITKIVIDGLITVHAHPDALPSYLNIGWALTNTNTYESLIERKCYIRRHKFPLLGDTISIPFHNELNCPDDTVTQRFFDIGDDYWEGGFFGLFFQVTVACFASFEIKWEAAQCTIYYETKTFDARNDLITDTAVPNELTTAADYTVAGVAVGDHWAIGVDYAVAFASCFSAVAPTNVPDIHYDVNGGTAIGKGVAQNFYGSTGFDKMEALREQLNYHVWMDADDERTLTIGPTSLMPYGAVVAPTPDFESNITIEHGPVANVAVVYKNGMIIKPTEVAGAVGLFKVQKESILTKEEAEALCDDLVTEYSETHYAAYAHYTKFPTVGASGLLELGHRYDITIDGVLYEDQPLRRLEWRNDGGTASYEVMAWFGLASTPVEERTAQEIGKLRKALRQQKQSFMSSTYAPITRHDSLNGITGAGTAHLASATATALEGDTYDADKLDGNHAAAFATAAQGATADAAEPHNDNIQTHITDDVITTAAQALAACVETEAWGSAWSAETKAPSKDDVWDAMPHIRMLDVDEAHQYYAGSADAAAHSCILDLVNRTHVETDMTQIADNQAGTEVCPSWATWVLIKLQVSANSTNVSNYAYVRENGHAAVVEGCMQFCIPVSGASNVAYNWVHMDANKKIQLGISWANGTVSAQITIMGWGYFPAV